MPISKNSAKPSCANHFDQNTILKQEKFVNGKNFLEENHAILISI